ncbi:SRPBCC family protein [Jidongwangia harbinensis]|uniref:SRPBCC family protein n=1 Tax=Jidongwangia harbinensis TaxID=2878561 RepID=UPI001CD98F83|nr:SRPBCC family protein [Jidongwangia harbinensis]MCA2218985.1 SRPBCC family protein [Jidongwangia harbinensis]
MRKSWWFGGLGLAVTAAYSPRARRWYLTWGATADEVARTMPGDELLLLPDIVSTRAVTIDAPPSEVWPWLVQMGSGRGGAYTYDWIENLLGLDMHSASEILPQFQHLAVGDVLPMGDGSPGMRVEVCDPEQTLTLRSEDGRWVWIFGLYPDVSGMRLVSRNRIAEPGASPLRRLADRLLMEPGSLVMERRMLLGIRDRAESVTDRPAPVPAH